MADRSGVVHPSPISVQERVGATRVEHGTGTADGRLFAPAATR